ncbi:MAG: hypothetical protein RSC43_00300 [Clostridia bacterium]
MFIMGKLPVADKTQKLFSSECLISYPEELAAFIDACNNKVGPQQINYEDSTFAWIESNDETDENRNRLREQFTAQYPTAKYCVLHIGGTVCDSIIDYYWECKCRDKSLRNPMEALLQESTSYIIMKELPTRWEEAMLSCFDYMIQGRYLTHLGVDWQSQVIMSILSVDYEPPVELHKYLSAYVTSKGILYTDMRRSGNDNHLTTSVWISRAQTWKPLELLQGVTYKHIGLKKILLTEHVDDTADCDTPTVYKQFKVEDGTTILVKGDIQIVSGNSYTPCIEAQGSLTICSATNEIARLKLIGSQDAPCIGVGTNGNLSYGRWSPSVSDYSLKLIIDNVDVEVNAKVVNFSLGAYGVASDSNTIDVELLRHATLTAPETTGTVQCVSIGETYEGSTKRTGVAVYELKQDNVHTDKFK